MTLIIIIITAIVSITAFNSKDMMTKYQFNPYMVNHHKEWHRFLTHGLLHADWIHLFFNMFVLYMFGKVVESWFGLYFGMKGMWYYLILYIGGIIVSVIPTYEKQKEN